MAVAVALMLRPGTLHVHTDCSEVTRALVAVAGRAWGEGRVTVTKVKAHALEPPRGDAVAWRRWQGNDFADVFARKGAQRHCEVRDEQPASGRQVTSHLMALAAWVGKQTKGLISGE
eukprot:3367732-Amphidinium_carterae.1